jgi:predicted metal-dependent phosphoesterase TrpH
LIDLHTHTTASDGRCSPAELVARASTAGVTVLAVTDHDTLGGCDRAAAACARAAITFVPGIEITAVCDGIDVHVLGYLVDRSAEGFLTFLTEQRRRRIDRARRMLDRLASHGIRLDADAILRPALENEGVAVGRPWIARALVEAGYVPTTSAAFEVWLSPGRPGFAPRVGAPPAEVIANIHQAGGVASLAHPGLLANDAWVGDLARAGLDALEAYHSEHDLATTMHYLTLALQLGLAVSGGSDYHGDPSHGPASPGAVALPREAYEELVARRPASPP